MLLFDLTPDVAATEAHSSLPENGTIRIELKFEKPLPETIKRLFHTDDGCVRIDKSRIVTTDLKNMDTLQIMCTLRDVESFLVLASDMLPPPRSITRPGTINTDPIQSGSHRLAIHLRHRTCSSTSSTRTACSPSCPIYCTFWKRAAVPCGITRRNCNASTAKSAAIIAACSLSTWTEGARPHNSWT